MAFPNQVHGSEGEQFSVYNTQRWPLGMKLILQDGREFRFAEVGGTSIATARVCQSEVPGANFDELVVPAAEAIGQTTLTITNGATAIAKDDFAEGYVNVEDDAGEGHLYKIKSNAAEAAGSANFDLVIEDSGRWEETATLNSGAKAKGLVVAWTTATTVGLTKNPFRDVIIHPSPPTAAVVGATPRALAANLFGWLQVKGPASVLTEGTLVIGDSVQASSSADGAVTPFVQTEAAPPVEITPVLGVTMELAATTEESLVALAIPGFS